MFGSWQCSGLVRRLAACRSPSARCLVRYYPQPSRLFCSVLVACRSRSARCLARRCPQPSCLLCSAHVDGIQRDMCRRSVWRDASTALIAVTVVSGVRSESEMLLDDCPAAGTFDSAGDVALAAVLALDLRRRFNRCDSLRVSCSRLELGCQRRLKKWPFQSES
jgi:hypothetical protein